MGFILLVQIESNPLRNRWSICFMVSVSLTTMDSMLLNTSVWVMVSVNLLNRINVPLNISVCVMDSVKV